jgi:hypothetical protein
MNLRSEISLRFYDLSIDEHELLSNVDNCDSDDVAAYSITGFEA